jgi:histidinol phosphatase-like PHP family hydrolase
MADPEHYSQIDFENTEIAFSHKSDKELKKTEWLFKLMNKQSLVKIGSFSHKVQATIYRDDCQKHYI